jgi:hypothetical protein
VSINLRNSNLNKRRAINGGYAGQSNQQQVDQAVISNAGNPYQKNPGGGGASLNNMSAQMAGSAGQGMQRALNPGGLQSWNGRGQNSGWTSGGYNGGLNHGNGISPHGNRGNRIEVLGAGSVRKGGDLAPQTPPSNGPNPNQQYGSDPQNPGAGSYGGSTADAMEDAIQKALEQWLAGANEQEIMDRYQRDTRQGIVDSRARMGALGMSGSGASASLQSGIQQRGADMAQRAISDENARLAGQAMNAVGMGIGLDDMSVRRALLEQLYGPDAGGNQIASPQKTGGNGNGGYNGGGVNVPGAPDNDQAFGSDYYDPNSGGGFINNAYLRYIGNNELLGGSFGLPTEASQYDLAGQVRQDGGQVGVLDAEQQYSGAPAQTVTSASDIPGWPGQVKKIDMVGNYTLYEGSDGNRYLIRGSH